MDICLKMFTDFCKFLDFVTGFVFFIEITITSITGLCFREYDETMKLFIHIAKIQFLF